MKYNISQTSKILGISNELLRHYERKGLIEPLRSETGYRSFDNSIIYKLIALRRFRSMGFSLKDISKLMYQNSHKSTHRMLLERENELEKEIIWQQTMLNSIKNIRKEYAEMINDEHKYKFETSPSVAILRTQNSSEYDTNNLSPELLQWLDKMPLVSICPEFTIEDLKHTNKKCNFGYSIPLEYAKRFSFTSSAYVKVIPQMPCIVTTIHTNGYNTLNTSFLSDTLSYIDSQGLELSNNVWGTTLGTYIENDKLIIHHKFYLPVRKR